MSDVYVYSTLANDNQYVVWKEQPDLPRVEHPILIKGGANVADKRGDTKPGAVTKITSDDLDALQGNEVFQRHVKNGFLFVTTDAPKQDPEAVAGDMEARDNSAPLVPQDFTEGDGDQRDGKARPTLKVKK